MKKVITDLEEALDIKTKEANHLSNLVAQMEASPGQDEMNKVQIADLKFELSKAEESLKSHADEVLLLKTDLRSKDDEIHHRQIDISCLKGQVMQEIDLDDEDDDDTLTYVSDNADQEHDVLLEDLDSE